MENASKALIMAGGVLISLLVIGILVFFFNNLQELQTINQSGEEVEQAAEFNKQYTAYERNVYGSELLSIASKVEDYNKRQAENKGYTKIELEVKINNNIDNQFFTAGTYYSDDLQEILEKVEKVLDSDTLGNKSIQSTETKTVSRKISQLASMKTKDIEELGINLEQMITIKIDNKTKNVTVQEAITTYNSLKTLLTEVKSKVFKCAGFEYDKNNGRITKMKYEL